MNETFVVRNSRPSESGRVPPPLQVLFLNVAISASDPHARLNPLELALHAADLSHTPISNSWSNRSSSR